MAQLILVGAAARGRPTQYLKEIDAVLPAALRGTRFAFDLHDGDDDWGPELPKADAVILTSRGFGAEAASTAKQGIFIQKLGLDLERVACRACHDRRIRISVLPDAGHVAVAEHALALVLSAARRIVPTHIATIRGDNPAALEPVRTTQSIRHVNWIGYSEDDFGLLADRTLGIVGFGAIAQEFARRAKPLFKRLVYTKRRQLDSEIEQRLGVTYLPLHELLAQADVVSLHAVQADGAPPIIGARELASMKSGAWLVNTARGNQIDQTALLRALQGQLGGAALDVFSIEPVVDRELLNLPNVILTPHIANLMPTGRRFAEALSNIEKVWAGQTPTGMV